MSSSPAAALHRSLGAAWRAALLPQAVALAVCGLYVHFVLGLPAQPLGELALSAVAGLALLGPAWTWAFVRLQRPVRGAAATLAAGHPPGGPPTGVAFRAAQDLPYRAALATLAAWLVLGATLGLVRGLGHGAPPLAWAGLVFGVLLVACGAVIYQLVGLRLALRPALEVLSTGAGVVAEALPVRRPLRLKMNLSFTALVFFACAFALLMSFQQSRELIDGLQEQATAVRSRGLARLVAQGQDPQLGEREGLAVVAADRAVLRRWGSLPDEQALADLTAQGVGAVTVDGRGLIGAVAALPAGTPQAIGAHVLLVVERPPAATRSLRLLILFMTLMFLAAAGLVHLSSRELSAPIQALADRAREMASGRLERPVPRGEADEIGILSEAFETMRAGLKEKIETIEQLNATLEEKVLARTGELQEALAKLRASQAQLVQSEKMASLGQLVAGVAHEINNPVNFILNTVEPLQELVTDLVAALDGYRAGHAADAQRLIREAGLQDAGPDALHMLRVMRNGADRTRSIVADLRSFSRLDEAELKPVRLEDGLGSTLNLLRPSLPPGVRVETDFALQVSVPCYAGSLNQVFMNLLNNAVQAAGEEGRVRVETRSEPPWAVVRILDDGPGVPEELRQRVFDPFYTTKEVGAGTGLGLSISLGVVQRHGGELRCTDAPGGGACFELRIPLDGPSTSLAGAGVVAEVRGRAD